MTLDIQETLNWHLGTPVFHNTINHYCFSKILIDPTVDEEDLSTSLITIVVKDEELCFVHKPGGTAITEERLLECVEESKKRASVIEKIVETALKSL